MAASDNKVEFDSNNRHSVHFYDDGNIMLDVKGMFFQVHKSILKLNSQTFCDMFSLPTGNASTGGPVETITLHDDPRIFAKLLDALYGGVLLFETSSIRQIIEVAELTRKYEMVQLEKVLLGHLERQLPISNSNPTNSPEKFKHYIRDHSLATLILRSGSPKLVPWALYAFGVYLNSGVKIGGESTYSSPPELSNVDHAYVYPLIVLQRVIQCAIEGWVTKTSKAFAYRCSNSPCSRKITGRPSFPPDNLDPIAWIANSGWLPDFDPLFGEDDDDEADGTITNWCPSCASSFHAANKTLSSDIYSQLIKYIT